MEIELLNKKLHYAYQSLVDTVEELVTEDGISLYQALDCAEENLMEWGELSKEDVQDISKLLKHNLQRLLKEHINESKESLKEKFKQHAAFVTDDTWDQLWKILYTNAVHLLSTEQNLEERILEISSSKYLTNISEVSHWNSDYELWLTEIALWEIQVAKTFNKLDEIKKAIKQHSNMLSEHAKVTHAHEVRGHAHEKVMFIAKEHPNIHVIDPLDNKENAMRMKIRQEYTQHAELHNSMQKDHSEMMSLVNKLHKHALQETV